MLTGPTNSRRSAISRQWQQTVRAPARQRSHTRPSEPRPPNRLANAQLDTDPYTPTPLERSSPIRGSGNNRTCTSTATVPYAPQPGHLAHPPLLFAWSISRSGKSHALMSRPQIVARLNNPRPPSAATNRHRDHHRGSDIAPPQPVHLPGARSVRRQSHAPSHDPLRRPPIDTNSAVTHIVHAFTVRLSSHHVLTRPSVRSHSLNSNQLALHSRRLDSLSTPTRITCSYNNQKANMVDPLHRGSVERNLAYNPHSWRSTSNSAATRIHRTDHLLA